MALTRFHNRILFWMSFTVKDETGVPVNYISNNAADSAFNNKILLRVLNLDNLDSRNEPNPDGRFDFVEGVTIIARDGRVFLPLLEPFGC